MVMDNYTQTLFESFLSPYSSLVDGSSCSFLTNSLNNLVDSSCNNNFPYIYALTALAISLSCLFFFLMILSYFLTVRMEFFEYLDGDLDNYDKNAVSDENIGLEMADFSSNRQQLLDRPTNRPPSENSYPQR